MLEGLLEASPWRTLVRVTDLCANVLRHEMEILVESNDYGVIAGLAMGTLVATGLWGRVALVLARALVTGGDSYGVCSFSKGAVISLVYSWEIMVLWKAHRMVKLDLEINRALESLVQGPPLPLDEESAYKEVADMREDKFETVKLM